MKFLNTLALPYDIQDNTAESALVRLLDESNQPRLALVYKRQDKYNEARRALAIGEKALESEHEHIGVSERSDGPQNPQRG